MCYKNEMAVSTPWGADGQILCLSIGRNRGKVTKLVVFATVGDGYQVFGISPVGDADTGDLALLCHIYCPLFFHNGIIGKLVPGDPATFLHKTYDPLALEFVCGNWSDVFLTR